MSNFWDFPRYSKLDILDEGDYGYNQLIADALADQETRIDQQNGRWIIYGNKEALLIRPISTTLKIALQIYYSITKYIIN